MQRDPVPQTSRELKFRRLARELRHRILDNTYPPDTKLPTEDALAAETGMSLTTIRHAYQELAADGLVVRRQGAGTFVAPTNHRVQPRQRVIGVLVPDTALYYPRVLQGIEKALFQANARLVLACSHYDPEAEDTAISGLLDAGVDGLLLVPSLHALSDPRARVSQLLELPVPVVFVERRLAALGPGDSMEHVCTDHEGGAYDAVRHLYHLGHREIGLAIRADAPTAPPILAGFERAIADFGLTHHGPQLIPVGEWNSRRADDAIKVLTAEQITAALCFGDREASLVLGAARRAGLAVPDDLAIIAYDNEFVDVAEVPMTAVSPPRYQLGQLAVQVLLQRLELGDALPIHQIHLRPRLVVRASCGAKPPSDDLSPTPP
ncbi:GntR family transcriptional regulator [Kribbella sp. NPDC004875]|uniref:GntR family transcriptional regulator n=1 Tax=Kribbella sp. NPDC004875 TaxID=3364107 RepID=UPI0036A9985E